MKAERTSVKNEPNKSQQGGICEECGRLEASLIAGRWLCDSCYAARGSCCPEFGADDLWSDESREQTS
jgi:hypothetical protein